MGKGGLPPSLASFFSFSCHPDIKLKIKIRHRWEKGDLRPFFSRRGGGREYPWLLLPNFDSQIKI